MTCSSTKKWCPLPKWRYDIRLGRLRSHGALPRLICTLRSFDLRDDHRIIIAQEFGRRDRLVTDQTLKVASELAPLTEGGAVDPCEGERSDWVGQALPDR